MTPAEQNRMEAADTFGRYVGMLAGTTAHVTGWDAVALVLADAASSALARAAEEHGPPLPVYGSFPDIRLEDQS
jgi:hypothetical protein